MVSLKPRRTATRASVTLLYIENGIVHSAVDRDPPMEISNLDSKIKSTSPGDPVLEANSSIHQQAIATSSPTVIYTPYYCEENVYQLLSSLSQTVKNRSYAVFISNPARTCILFQQKASQRDEHDGFFVVWDYHVIVVTVLTDTDSVCVLDRDSRLPYSCSLSKYVEETFRPALFTSGILPRELESRFRVVPSSDFLSNFASDRSHMVILPCLIRTDLTLLTLGVISSARKSTRFATR
ncbi:hypothetical protein T439DRAFT_157290 [Meredithblackwellia eburnea MCA 4105]